MTVESSPAGFTVAHPHSPYDATLHLSGFLEISETLNSCRNTLHLLAELFLAKADHADLFGCDSSRMGMFHQLHGLAGTLAAIDHALTQIDAPETTKADP